MTSRRRKGMTLAEHDAELKQKGLYDAVVAKRETQEAALREHQAESRRAQAPLVRELQAAGYSVVDVWDLVNTAAPYPEALPVLLRHLDRPYPEGVREGIARALAVRNAKFAWPTLVELFQTETSQRVKDGLAAALSAIADDDVAGQLIELVLDRRHGASRVLLVPALERLHDESALATLQQLIEDPDVAKEARFQLRKRARRTRRRPPN